MNIEYIIEQRMKLQSTVRTLESFGIKIFNLKFFNSKEFKKNYNSWGDSTKKSFLIALGGKANMEKTRQFIEKI